MKQKILILLIALVPLFWSCKPQEERVIDRLQRLADKVENQSKDWNEEDWTDAIDDYEEINAEMQDCNFTSEQLQKIGHIDGALTVAFVKNGSKFLGSKLNQYLNGAGDFLKGFSSGIEESIDEEELESTINNLTGEIESFMDNFKDEE